MTHATEPQMAREYDQHLIDAYIADLPDEDYWTEEPDRIERE